jgi:hypothetical protein
MSRRAAGSWADLSKRRPWAVFVALAEVVALVEVVSEAVAVGVLAAVGVASDDWCFGSIR